MENAVAEKGSLGNIFKRTGSGTLTLHFRERNDQVVSKRRSLKNRALLRQINLGAPSLRWTISPGNRSARL